MVTYERGGFPLLYLTATDPVAEELTAGEHTGYEFRLDCYAARHPRMRRAFVRPTRFVFFGALHWADGTDLDLLDTLADRGADIGAAVDRAVFGVFASPICRACHTSHLILGIDGGFGEVTPSQRSRHWSRLCPTCGDEDYASHVEVLDA